MSKRAQRGQVIELGGEPRINFLPPEIQQRKDARRRRRSLFMLVILVGVLCGIGIFYAVQYANQQQSALEAEQQTTLDLLSEQSRYAEANALAARVALTANAITHITHNEVMWREIVTDVLAVLPDGVDVTQWAIVGASPLEYPQPTTGLFPIDRVASVDISASVKGLATVSEAIDLLSAVPGVIDVNVTSVQLDDELSAYTTVFTVSFSTEALEGRFADGWEPGALPPPSEPESPPADDAETGNESEEGEE